MKTELSLTKLLARSLLLLTLALSGPLATAGDEGVYGPAAPPNSAFVRVFNATSGGVNDGKVGDKVIEGIPDFGASEFVFLPPGSYKLTAGGKTQDVKLEKNKYYTAALTSEGIKLIDNVRYTNRLKSLIIVYNLTDTPDLNVRAGDGRPVVNAVAPDSSGSREVNPIKVNLDLYEGDKKISSVKPVNLERGKAYSLFVTGDKSNPSMTWAVS